MSWARERVGELVTGTEDGRARVSTDVTLTGRAADGAITGTEARQVRFLLAGPQDVAGLKPGAVVGRYPVPGAVDAETDKCPHVEFADAALPWRYTPAANPAAGTGVLRPWLALVVGVEGTELTLAGDSVSLGTEVQNAHPLAAPHPHGHVQQAEGRHLARLLSTRPLAADTDYVALLVPAVPGWTGAAPVTLPVYDSWRFRTAAQPGSFAKLAARLTPGGADPATGRAPVRYPYLADRAVELRGALAPIGSTDPDLDPAIAVDLPQHTLPPPDPRGRPVIGPPVYGALWPSAATAWAAGLNGDPRHRGAAGLGLELGVRLQEQLVEEAREHAGALAVAAQWLGRLSLGLAASGALWRRRLPADPLHRLWLFGPALRRVVTPQGPVAELTTAKGLALPPGIFSTAARRAVRPGPARTTLLRGAIDPAAVLRAADRCPRPPGPSEDGVPPLGRRFDERLKEALASGRLDSRNAVEGLRRFDVRRLPKALQEPATALLGRLIAAASDGRTDLAWGRSIEALTASAAADPRDERALAQARERLEQALKEFGRDPELPGDLVGLLDALAERPGREPPCRPVDLDALAASVTPLFDPTAEDAPARVRVLAGIDGLDPAQPLAPPEVCVGLDRPVWRDLNDAFAEWLLPGAGNLPDDSVNAVQTNPVFTDAFLVGYNTQLVGELRWRNLPIATGCTPLRVFWDRADTASGQRVDDIVGVANWPPGSALGAAEHRPGGAAGGDLVLLFRGQLFLRYPKTLLYLVSAVHGGGVDFDADPDPAATRVLPAFQGRIGADITFFGFQDLPAGDIASHWVVLEEPPSGYRFFNDAVSPAGRDGARFADEAFADPVRVLVRGDGLTPSTP
ncbi:hypothetical protein [Kitasatospora sp. NPDC085879]|uniref:hypothetical protein n=1 Tax=Kitasatospora sp. NPDC085879 TaxID=3154769 RepID=UPI003447352C